MRSRPALALGLLFFLSGATGLVYELLWVRLLYQSFGSTIQSVTTVVAAYMGGLGLGAWILGRRADRHARPAALYGRLEILIGLFGLASPFVLAGAQRLYIAVAAGAALPGWASLTLRFGVAGLVLLVPTTLMGGTLPVLTRALTGPDRNQLRLSLGTLYGLNTIGAVAGAALAGFVLIEFVGIHWSLWGTAAMNLALGAGALLLARRFAPLPPATPAPAEWQPDRTLVRTALALLAVTAFVALLDEIAWTRVLVMVIGGSTYAFTLIIVVFLLGIALGSAIVARKATDSAATAGSAALAQGIAAAGAALILVFFTALPRFILSMLAEPASAPGPRLAQMGFAVGAALLVPTLGMGMTFPLLVDLVAPPGDARGGDVGRAYALNTLGSIAGAAITGFFLVTWLGSDRTLRLGVLMNAAAALALATIAARGVAEGSAAHRRLLPRVGGAALLAMAALVAAVASPRWSTRLIDLGPTVYGRGLRTAAERQGFLGHAGARQLSFVEGRNATTSVWEAPVGRTLRLNGKVDASDYGDMDTQIMLGLAPALARPHPGSALVIGFGSGVTTSVLAAVPGMGDVEVVELEPAVLAAARYFREATGDVLERPNVHTVSDDARSALQLTRSSYDVIVSEPSNPWVAGVATLYTPEFYRIVQSRLTEAGVFCQWVQLYQLPLPVLAGIVRSLGGVFPYVQVWFGSPYDLTVLGSSRPIVVDSAWLRALTGPGGPFAQAVRDYLGAETPADLMGHLLLDSAGSAALAGRSGLTHTDDRPTLEYRAARSFLIDGVGIGIFDTLVSIARDVEHWEEGGAPVLRLAQVLAGSAVGQPYLREAAATHPEDRVWIERLAAIRVTQEDTTLADSILPRTPAESRDPRALQLAGLIAVQRKQTASAQQLLGAALAAGGDTARIHAALAVLDVADRDWSGVATHIRAALRVARNTLRTPFPRDLVAQAMTPLAVEGPPAVADSLLAAISAARPGWPNPYELRTIVALRQGRCEDAVALLELLLEFGVERQDGPELVGRCVAARR